MTGDLRQESCSVQGYLERIGYHGPLDGSVKTLSALQEAHVLTVPYENLDIMAGKSLSIQIPDVYEKVVVKRRGGYCFELNGLFAWLLRELKYDVTEYYGRFLLGEPTDIPMRRHRISRVQVEGEIYICDVGVGIPAPRQPLLFKEGLEQKQGDETYRLVSDPVLGWVVQSLHNNGRWDNIYSFTEDVQYLIDFEMPHFWCITHPDSIFKNFNMAYIRTPDGRKTIADVEDEEGKKVQEFRRFSPKGVETFIPKTDAEYREALKSYFGIVLD